MAKEVLSIRWQIQGIPIGIDTQSQGIDMMWAKFQAKLLETERKYILTDRQV